MAVALQSHYSFCIYFASFRLAKIVSNLLIWLPFRQYPVFKYAVSG